MKQHNNSSILVINPGGTSTRVSLFAAEQEVFTENLRHPSGEIDRFEQVYDQLPWRLEMVRHLLDQRGVVVPDLDAVVGRGPPLVPVPSGTFAVDDAMLDAIARGDVMVHHPSLLGAPMADALAREAGCRAFVVDPVTVDELLDEARLTGLPEITRRPLSHALSVKAVSRKAAASMGVSVEEINLIVLHLGSGTTVAAQRRGRQIDSNDPTASGPMAPTRAGSLPSLDLARKCFAGATMHEVERRVVEDGGWAAHLGTDDVREIYERIDGGQEEARRVIDATIHQLVKEVGGLFGLLDGKVDALVMTGGVVRCHRFVEELEGRLGWAGVPTMVFPGENEMESLALGALRALRGECRVLRMPLV